MTPMLRVVSGLLANRDGKVLMGKRPMGKKRGGLWELPGGKVDAGEKPHEALAREWMEEIGIAVSATDFVASAVLQLEVTFTIELYGLERDTYAVMPLLNHAHDQLMWLDVHDAVENLPCSPAFYLHYPFITSYLGLER